MPNRPNIDHAEYHLRLGESAPILERLSPEELNLIRGSDHIDKTPLYTATALEFEQRFNPVSPELEFAPESRILFNFSEHILFARSKAIEEELQRLAQLRPLDSETPIFNSVSERMFGREWREKLLNSLVGTYKPRSQEDIARQLLEKESAIGASAFWKGADKEGYKFFKLDDMDSWLFAQPSKTAKNSFETTRYVVLKSGLTEVSKAEGMPLIPVPEDMKSIFMFVARKYHDEVMVAYGRDPQTGKKLQ